MARARVCHQARELILKNFLTVFSLVYPEEGSIAETSVKILIVTASVLGVRLARGETDKYLAL